MNREHRGSKERCARAKRKGDSSWGATLWSVECASGTFTGFFSPLLRNETGHSRQKFSIERGKMSSSIRKKEREGERKSCAPRKRKFRNSKFPSRSPLFLLARGICEEMKFIERGGGKKIVDENGGNLVLKGMMMTTIRRKF